MSMKTKRTYNLSSATVAMVKRLVDEEHVAPSQDALVEKAVAELDRLTRDADDARLWGQAAHDPAFQDEIHAIEADMPADDPGVWTR